MVSLQKENTRMLTALFIKPKVRQAKRLISLRLIQNRIKTKMRLVDIVIKRRMEPLIVQAQNIAKNAVQLSYELIGLFYVCL